jgi:hypothetical protein
MFGPVLVPNSMNSPAFNSKFPENIAKSAWLSPLCSGRMGKTLEKIFEQHSSTGGRTNGMMAFAGYAGLC